MAARKGRGWKLLVIAEDESQIRQFRLPRKAVVTLISVAALLIIYAGVETVLFWMVARRAAQVEPLKRRVRELESSSDELTRMGTELNRLRTFEQQLRRVLSGKEGETLESLPWDASNFNELPSGEQSVNLPKPGISPVAEARGVGNIAFTAMDLPTVPPVRGFVTRGYLPAKAPRWISHDGMDIAAREGAPILAAADGLVLFSEWTYRYGHLVVLIHRSGYVTFYGHNQVLLARSGERVRQGQPIALLGNSGLSTAPHLHFEIWQDGNPVNPTTLLRSSP
ncbi:M23 family metallopeptidase [candidate division KSB1 bacterium]|nr:MAG: M23 family metallopeptidase [candidate division KSB1 bacterium]